MTVGMGAELLNRRDLKIEIPKGKFKMKGSRNLMGKGERKKTTKPNQTKETNKRQNCWLEWTMEIWDAGTLSLCAEDLHLRLLIYAMARGRTSWEMRKDAGFHTQDVSW